MYSMNRSFEDNWVMEKIEDERHIEMVSIRDADIISAAHTEHSSNTGPFGKYMASAYYQTKKLIEALIPNSLLSLRKHDFKDLKDPVYLLGKLYCKSFVLDLSCLLWSLKLLC